MKKSILVAFALFSLMILLGGVSALVCTSNPSTAQTSQQVKFVASGVQPGTTTYSWSIPGGSFVAPSTSSTNPTNVTYSTTGLKVASVTATTNTPAIKNCRGATINWNNVGNGQVVSWINCDGSLGSRTKIGIPSPTINCAREGSINVEDDYNPIFSTPAVDICGTYTSPAIVTETASCSATIASNPPPSLTTCTNPSQIIMRLYSTNNTHGEVWNGSGNYPVEICYEKIFGTQYDGANPHVCNPTKSNMVLSLYTPTNSHIEAIFDYAGSTPSLKILPGSSPGVTDICYGDLSCILPTDNICPPTRKEVVALSSLINFGPPPIGILNSHIAYNSTLSGYGSKICCSSPSAQPTATPLITKTNWTTPLGVFKDEALLIEEVNLTANTSNIPVGAYINFSVYNSSNNINIANYSAMVFTLNGIANVRRTVSSIVGSKAGVGANISYVARYYDASGNPISEMRSGNLTLVSILSPEITEAKWKKGSTTIPNRGKVNVDEPVKTFGLTENIPSGATIDLNFYDEFSNQVPGANYNLLVGSISQTSQITASATYSLEINGNEKTVVVSGTPSELLNKPNNQIIGNNYSFTLEYYDAGGNLIAEEESELIKIVNEVEDCTGLPYAECIVSTPMLPPPISPDLPNCPDTGFVTACKWEGGACNNGVVFKDASNTLATCTYQFAAPGECGSDGKRTVGVSATFSASSPLPPGVTCSGPCNVCPGGVCTIPCARSVASLPFFGAMQLVAALIIVAIVYYAIVRSKKKK